MQVWLSIMHENMAFQSLLLTLNDKTKKQQNFKCQWMLGNDKLNEQKLYWNGFEIR